MKKLIIYSHLLYNINIENIQRKGDNMEWVITNIDDLTELEKSQLKKYVHYNVFRGLFIMSKTDLEDWKATECFDDWIVGVFPESYISNGWFDEDLDHQYDAISDFIYNKNEKLLIKFNEILDNEHKNISIEDVKDYILIRLNKWSEKEFKKYDNNSEELYRWLANEISKTVK